MNFPDYIKEQIRETERIQWRLEASRQRFNWIEKMILAFLKIASK